MHFRKVCLANTLPKEAGVTILLFGKETCDGSIYSSGS